MIPSRICVAKIVAKPKVDPELCVSGWSFDDQQTTFNFSNCSIPLWTYLCLVGKVMIHNNQLSIMIPATPMSIHSLLGTTFTTFLSPSWGSQKSVTLRKSNMAFWKMDHWNQWFSYPSILQPPFLEDVSLPCLMKPEHISFLIWTTSLEFLWWDWGLFIAMLNYQRVSPFRWPRPRRPWCGEDHRQRVCSEISGHLARCAPGAMRAGILMVGRKKSICII